MKVLHLFSNTKWTGPAEPALNLCASLKAAGVETEFVCGRATRGALNKIAEEAERLELTPPLILHLSKHRHPLRNRADVRTLSRHLEKTHYDLVHCHLDNDHRIAVGAVRGKDVPVVRTSYHGVGFTGKRGGRAPGCQRLLAATRFLIEPSCIARDHDAAAYAFPGERIAVVPGAVDTERFDPARKVPDGRAVLQIPDDAFVIGIVARMQTHRRYEEFWEGLRQLMDGRRDIHVVVVGRGTRQDRVAMGPVRALGLQDRVHFPGYLDGDEYVGMLKAFDAKVFLVPGSDETCRAVREAMAMGKPVVAARRGMLPEIVGHEKEGYIFDGGAEGLVAALTPLANNPEQTHRMGAAARQRAVAEYSLPVQAAQVLKIYESIVGRRT